VQTDDGPLNRQCGRAYGEQVTIDNCKATIQAHAYQHSDHPLPSYLGPVGLEITLEKTGSKWTLTVVPSTPVNTTKFTIKGPVTGTIAMSSCP
jgi:hypothetical protein